MPLSRRQLLGGASAFLLGGALSSCAAPAERAQAVWSTYAVGTGTYNDLAGVANAMTQSLGRQIRLMTSATGMGRMAPLINGTADLVRAADEYGYAFEGDEEFCSPLWGPQRVRQVWSPPGNYGVLVLADSGIERVEDLRGRRVPNVIGSSGINRKIEAVLNVGGLTRTDTNLVPIGYSEQVAGIKSGQIEALYHSVSGSNIEELASQFDVRWLDLHRDDDSSYSSWETLVPIARPGRFTGGAGMKNDESVVSLQYSIPLAVLDSRPADEVHQVATQLHSTFDKYKGSTRDTPSFAVDKLMFDPMIAPFHEGAIRFFKQNGVWTGRRERRQQALLERESLLHEHWPAFIEANKASEDLKALWTDWKQENLPALPGLSESSTVAGEPGDHEEEAA